jgi:hypothetical protein
VTNVTEGTCELARYQHVLWTAPVEVGGVRRRFVLDFGAGITSLDARLVGELGLAQVDRVSGRRMRGDRLDIPRVGPVPLGVAGVDLGPRVVGCFDFSSLLPPGWPPFDGVLALDVLEDRPFSVDFARGVLRIGPTPESRSLAPVPARLYRQIPAVSLVVLLAVAAPDEDLWFELDSANAGPVFVAPASAGRLGLDAAAAWAEIGVRGLDAFRTPVVVHPLIYDGNLGRTFTDGRTFAFDLRDGRVRIGPSERPAAGPVVESGAP